MTEDEAKIKWCPFVRYTQDGPDAAANRWGEKQFPLQSLCIASRCMMWVTTEGHNDQGSCGLAKGG